MSPAEAEFNVLSNLSNQGFQTWISKRYDVDNVYQIDVNFCTDRSPTKWKPFDYERLKNSFVDFAWTTYVTGTNLLFKEHTVYAKWTLA